MNPRLGWTMAAAALAVGFWIWSWPGIVLALTVVVFWLLLQWGRAMRVMRHAAERPVGSVASAVMLQSRLQPGMTMLQVLPLTRSIGIQPPAPPAAAGAPADVEHWLWQDEAGHRVETEWRAGRLHRWSLVRAEQPDAEDRPERPAEAAAPGAAS